MKAKNYLGGKVQADGKYRQVSAGTPGPGIGKGTGLPKSSAKPLTGIEKPLKDKGV